MQLKQDQFYSPHGEGYGVKISEDNSSKSILSKILNSIQFFFLVQPNYYSVLYYRFSVHFVIKSINF